MHGFNHDVPAVPDRARQSSQSTRAAAGLKPARGSAGPAPAPRDGRAQTVRAAFMGPPQARDSRACCAGRLRRNAKLRALFNQALTGEFTDLGLPFDSGRNMHKPG